MIIFLNYIFFESSKRNPNSFFVPVPFLFLHFIERYIILNLIVNILNFMLKKFILGSIIISFHLF